jgi:hypothetical protein
VPIVRLILGDGGVEVAVLARAATCR